MAEPIDPNGMYLVELTKPVKIGRRWYYPGSRLVLRGDVLLNLLATDPDAVAYYEQVPWPTLAEA